MITELRTARSTGVDVLRGLAVVLMVADHSVALVWPSSPVRYSLTRLSLPLFALVLGSLASKSLSNRRRAQWFGAFVVVQPLYVLAGLNGGLLLVWLALGRWVARGDWLVRFVAVVAGMLSLANGVTRAVAGEYDVLGVIGLVVLGVGNRDAIEGAGQWVRGRCGFAAVVLEWIGGRPMAWYVGHLVVLAAVNVSWTVTA